MSLLLAVVGGEEQLPLHGRRVLSRRGRIVRFADEIDPVEVPRVPTFAQRQEARIEYGDLLGQVRELTQRFEVAQRQKRESEARQRVADALSAEIASYEARIAYLAQVEAAWIARLREEDEFFLLAA